MVGDRGRQDNVNLESQTYIIGVTYERYVLFNYCASLCACTSYIWPVGGPYYNTLKGLGHDGLCSGIHLIIVIIIII